LRRENIDAILEQAPRDLDCVEIHPENYMGTGGHLYRQFRQVAERYPVVVHGLSLSVGSSHPLSKDFLKKLKVFLDEIDAPWMSDHLCYSSVFGSQFHDLLPLPFTREAVRNVVAKIKKVQDYLERPFAVENVSYYAAPAKNEMTEWEFLSEVASGADCSLLLDVNNIYVNSVNHRFDPYEYLRAVPYERVLHMHIAGHMEYEDFLLDTHGAPVIDPVWDLLRYVADRSKPRAVIIERDNHVPPLSESLEEVRVARNIMRRGLDHQQASETPRSGRMAAGASR